jgi:hypothetical protein
MDWTTSARLLLAELVRELAVATEIAGHERGVDLTGVEHDLRHVLEDAQELLAGPGEVDGVAPRRSVGKMRGDALLKVVGERRKLQPLARGDIGRDDAVTASVADDDDPAAARMHARELRLREVDQLPGSPDVHHPGR